MSLSFLAFTLTLALGLNFFFFIFAYTFKTDKFTDFTYGLTFILLTLLYLNSSGTSSDVQIALAGLVIIWAVRLISYLLIRILKIKKDSRFDKMRTDLKAYLQFWLGQGFVAWVVLLPASLVLSGEVALTNNPLTHIGLVIWMLGFLIETVADHQKFTFKNKKGNKNKWVDVGLWKYSQHPNYFGEMLLWWGIFIFVLPALSGFQYATIIGPLFITHILINVTGIPPLQARYDKKYKGNKEYQKYKRSTSRLVPLPKL